MQKQRLYGRKGPDIRNSREVAAPMRFRELRVRCLLRAASPVGAVAVHQGMPLSLSDPATDIEYRDDQSAQRQVRIH